MWNTFTELFPVEDFHSWIKDDWLPGVEELSANERPAPIAPVIAVVGSSWVELWKKICDTLRFKTPREIECHLVICKSHSSTSLRVALNIKSMDEYGIFIYFFVLFHIFIYHVL